MTTAPCATTTGHFAREALIGNIRTGAMDGSIFAFVPGIGLLRTTESSLQWVFMRNDFAGRSLLHIIVDSSDTRRIYAVTDARQVVASYDQGASWTKPGELPDADEQ